MRWRTDQFERYINAENRLGRASEAQAAALTDIARVLAGVAGALNRLADRVVDCEHGSVAEEGGFPDRDGRVRVFAVCEECGKVLGQTGWDSV